MPDFKVKIVVTALQDPGASFTCSRTVTAADITDIYLPLGDILYDPSLLDAPNQDESLAG